jgi:hypothetical protein
VNRRLYFLIPDRAHALSVVDELVNEGVAIRNMHTLGGKGKELDGLPAASGRQYNDTADHLESFLWNANLMSFFVALGIFFTLLLTTGWNLWLLVPAVIMMANFTAGLRFTRLPNTHLGEFREALRHGEILLMVDVPEGQVADIENLVRHHHPETTVGGVSWGSPAFSL